MVNPEDKYREKLHLALCLGNGQSRSQGIASDPRITVQSLRNMLGATEISEDEYREKLHLALRLGNGQSRSKEIAGDPRITLQGLRDMLEQRISANTKR
jgi:uncharacterized protein YneF (UPF0154 family)